MLHFFIIVKTIIYAQIHATYPKSHLTPDPIVSNFTHNCIITL